MPLWDRVILFELPITAKGKLDLRPDWFKDWTAMAQAIEASGAGFDLAFTLLDEGRFKRLFSHPESRDTLLRQILSAARLGNVKGIHLDFEVFRSMPVVAMTGYRDFMTTLYRRLQLLPREQRPVLSVFFPIGGEQDLLDTKTLEYPDYVVVQGYDAHWAESETAGPVAPLNGPYKLSWEKTLERVLALGVPRSKILFSIPYFGYEWPVESEQMGAAARGHGVTTSYAPVDAGLLPKIRIAAMERIARYPIKRDPESGSPYYVYQTPAGKWYQGWFEDAVSLAEKFDFVAREKLCGVAVFPLGYDNGFFNRLIADKFGARQKIVR